ncbi:MAG TPA: hypothetical protein VIG66_00115 [Noviherbaspirillum sp.]
MNDSDLNACSSPLRRRVLRRMTAAGGFALAPVLLHAAPDASGSNVQRLQGEVRIDSKPLRAEQSIGYGQKLETGDGAELVFVTGAGAFLMRENSALVLEQQAGMQLMRVWSGKVLAAFGSGQRHIDTPTAAIGLRNAACYIEVEPARTYFCLCRGRALLAPKGDPNRRKSLRAERHEYPVYIDRSAGPAAVLAAHVVNHEDEELAMLEALVGRKSAFAAER